MTTEKRASGGAGQPAAPGQPTRGVRAKAPPDGGAAGASAGSASAGSASAAPAAAGDAAATGKRRVLIVEDDTLVGMGLRSLLERLGHEVVGQASTTAEASVILRGKQPDIVLMDIRLDGADGIELARELLSQRRCPMIIISAFSDRALIDRASAAGVFGYLIKPVTAEALAAQIEVAVRRFRETEELHQKNLELSQTLENRKAV